MIRDSQENPPRCPAPSWLYVLRRVVLFCVAISVASIADADIVRLKAGNAIEGKIVSETATEIEIQTKFGQMKIQKSNIAKIERKLLPEEDIKKQIADAGDSPAKLWDAASFAKENKLMKDYQAILEKIIEVDPQHSDANQALGRVYYDDQWFSPEELARYKVTVEKQMQAKGMVMHDGKWIKESTAKRLQGLEEYKGEWLTWKEIYRLQAAEKMPELLGISLDAVESEHFTMWSELGEEQSNEILEMLESGFDHFVQVFKPDEIEYNLMTFYPIATYVLPSASYVSTFVEDGGYMKQLYNPPKGINERYISETSFAIFFPRPLMVSSVGRHLQGGGSKLVSLSGFLSHFAGNIYIRRFRRNGKIAGWVESGVTHYYEGRLNGFRTLTIDDYKGFEHIQRWADGLSNMKEWYEHMSKPEFRASLPRFSSFKGKMVEELGALELVKSYYLVAWLLETDPEKFVEYVRRAYSDPHARRTPVPEEQAFEEVFGISVDEFEERFERWASNIPPMPPV